jgi:hypothetical protein
MISAQNYEKVLEFPNFLVPLQPLLRDKSMKFKFLTTKHLKKWQQKSDCSAAAVRAMLSTAS